MKWSPRKVVRMTRSRRQATGGQSLQSLIANVKIASPAFKANPQPFYHRLRTEAPVCRVPLPGKQSAWLVTRYDDVAAVLKDSRFIKEKAQGFLRRASCSPALGTQGIQAARAKHARCRPA